MGTLVASLALALACVVVIVAVAPIRSAVAGLLGVDGVHITQVGRLPVLPTTPTAPTTRPSSSGPTLPTDLGATLHLGRPTTLIEAARTTGFPIRLPTIGAYRQPDAVYVGAPPAGGMAALVYLPKSDRPPVPTGGVAGLLTEFRGHLEAGYFQKLAGPGTSAVRGGPSIPLHQP
jgi:hypothetical protein